MSFVKIFDHLLLLLLILSLLLHPSLVMNLYLPAQDGMNNT